LCYIGGVKRYVHARLTAEERAVLERLKKATGASESEILRRGLQLVARERAEGASALDLAGPAVGRFKRGPRDLSSNPRHLDEFGK
jgi:hypothetical protein